MNAATELVAPREAAPGELHDDTPVTTSEDVRRLNRKLALRQSKWGGLRPRRAFFRCPWPITRTHFDQYANAAIEKWIGQLDKEGWDLKGKPVVNANKRREATQYSGDWSVPLMGYVEVPVTALFQKRKVEAMRIEVPVAAA